MIDQSALWQMRWDEQALTVYKLHLQKQCEFGQSSIGRIKEGWSVRDTANLIRRSVGWVCESIKLAKKLEEKPSFKKFTTRSTALASLNPTKAYLEDGTNIFVRGINGSISSGKIAGHGFIDREHVYIVRLDSPIYKDDMSFYYISVRNDRVEERI